MTQVESVWRLSVITTSVDFSCAFPSSFPETWSCVGAHYCAKKFSQGIEKFNTERYWSKKSDGWMLALLCLFRKFSPNWQRIIHMESHIDIILFAQQHILQFIYWINVTLFPHCLAPIQYVCLGICMLCCLNVNKRWPSHGVNCHLFFAIALDTLLESDGLFDGLFQPTIFQLRY